MKVMTIRGLDVSLTKALKTRAKQKGISIGLTLLHIIKEGLGLKKKSRNVIHNDLGHLAGTWNDEDLDEFKKIKDFEKIDKDLWK